MKRTLIIVLSAIMVIGLLTACAEPNTSGNNITSQTPEGSQAVTPEGTTATTTNATQQTKVEVKPLKFGYSGFGDATVMEDYLRPVKWAVEGAGGELVVDYAQFSPEGQISSVENLISAGCNIVIYSNIAGEASIPQVSKICQENKVHWVLWDTDVTTPEILEVLESDPYFVGFTNEDQKQTGYDGMRQLIEAGAKKIIVYKYATGVATCDYRVEGALKACEELNGEVVATLEAPEDQKAAMESVLLAHPEADGLFLAGGGQLVIPMAEAIKQADRKISISTIDLFDGLDTYLDDQTILVCRGGHYVTGFAAALMAINAYYETPLSTDKYKITIPEMVFTSAADYTSYKQYCENDDVQVYTPDDIKQFLKIYSPDLTVDSFQKLINDTWNMESITKKFS